MLYKLFKDKSYRGNPVPGYLCVLGGFLIELMLGAYYTFGNTMPYMVSYMRSRTDPLVTYSSFAQVQFIEGIVNGVSNFLAGIFLVPYLGNRLTLLLGILAHSLGPLLTRFALDWSLTWVYVTYGIIQGFGNMSLLIMYTVPTSWFPSHRGKINGLITAGYGISSLLLSPIQLAMTNPDNVPALPVEGSEDLYYTDTDLLDRVPMLLYSQSLMYAVVMMVGFSLFSEPKQEQGTLVSQRECTSPNMMSDVTTKPPEEGDFDFDINGPSTTSHQSPRKNVLLSHDIYILVISRIAITMVASGISAYYKAFALTFVESDRFITAYISSLTGIWNCLSRLVFGTLYDLVPWKWVMGCLLMTLMILTGTLYFTADIGKVGLVAWMYGIYFTFPGSFGMMFAKVMELFGQEQGRIAMAWFSLAPIFANFANGLIGSLIFTGSTIDYLYYFLLLAGTLLLAFVGTLFQTRTPLDMRRGTAVCLNTDQGERQRELRTEPL